MRLIEFRVILPLTVDEYQVGQLWSVAEASHAETGGGEGVEILRNEPYENCPLLHGKFSEGQYTHKIYHLDSKAPWLVRQLAPSHALEIHEEAWNAYPYCRTILTNPGYMKDNFYIRIETMHLPDRGTAHELPPELLKIREVVVIDITNDKLIKNSDYLPETDPKLWRSTKTGRGPLSPGWQQTAQPVMCAYKLLAFEFKWWGIQTKVESFIANAFLRLFAKFHREVVCWMDNWHGLNMQDIREHEALMKKKLDEQRKNGISRGMTGD